MKTAVEAVFISNERLYNRRSLQMCSYYSVHPVGLHASIGWEDGQVKNQLGIARDRFLTPCLRVKSLEELNVRLLEKALAMQRPTAIPNRRRRRSDGCSKPDADTSANLTTRLRSSSLHFGCDFAWLIIKFSSK